MVVASSQPEPEKSRSNSILSRLSSSLKKLLPEPKLNNLPRTHPEQIYIVNYSDLLKHLGEQLGENQIQIQNQSFSNPNNKKVMFQFIKTTNPTTIAQEKLPGLSGGVPRGRKPSRT